MKLRQRQKLSLFLGLAMGIAGVVAFAALLAVGDTTLALGLLANTLLFGSFVVLFVWRPTAEVVPQQTETENILPMARVNALGLLAVSPDSSRFDYREIIEDSRRLVVVLNDGRTWLSMHRERLRARFADNRKQTTIFLVHPRSEFINVLARKGSSDPAAQIAKIHESLQILREVVQEGTNIEVLGHFLYNTHSLVLGDEIAAVTPYYLSRGSRSVPVYVYGDDGGSCYFKELEGDVERLRMDSEALKIPESPGGLKTDRVVPLRSA